MTRVAGLLLTSSERAFDLFLEDALQYVSCPHGHAQRGGIRDGDAGGQTITRPATHDAPSAAQPAGGAGPGSPDAWAATFGESVTALEIAPDGSGYRMHTRFARFINVPELMAVFGEVA